MYVQYFELYFHAVKAELLNWWSENLLVKDIQGINTVSIIHPMGTMNVHTKLYVNPFKSWRPFRESQNSQSDYGQV